MTPSGCCAELAGGILAASADLLLVAAVDAVKKLPMARPRLPCG